VKLEGISKVSSAFPHLAENVERHQILDSNFVAIVVPACVTRKGSREAKRGAGKARLNEEV
jgi:hypothetical protein